MIERSYRNIVTYGLNAEQNQYIESCFPTKDYNIDNCNNYEGDDFIDWVTTRNDVFIINATVLPEYARELILECYDEINESFDETVIWLGEPKPPQKIAKNIKCYNSFDELRDNLKYVLLTAHKKSRKAAEYCKILEKGIRILYLIRRYPGITTKELSDKTDMSIRSVQRYIEALQTAGEWIEYNTQKKGWQLHDGYSVLFETNYTVLLEDKSE